jgi:hypothetical protein
LNYGNNDICNPLALLAQDKFLDFRLPIANSGQTVVCPAEIAAIARQHCY